MRILLSAYACAPESGSEPGAGYALLRAAAGHGECWLLTRHKHAEPVRRALDAEPTAHPVHVVPVDAGPLVLALKRRTGNVRGYYALWQRLAARAAVALDRQHDFDLVHHATFSTFWLPVGVSKVPKPLIIGPVSGGSLTPRPLLGYLGPRYLRGDAVRYAVTRGAGLIRRTQWQRRSPIVIAQEHDTERFLRRWVLAPEAQLDVHPHASDPALGLLESADRRNDEVLFVGRLLGWKGTALALAAFAEARLPATRLVFIGEGPDRARLERRAEQLGMGATVEFTGRLPRANVLARMRAAAALLFPSFHDSAGFVVSEALTMGLPVICLDHGGPGALVRLWPDGQYVAVRPRGRRQVIHELAAALMDFTTSPRPVPRKPRPASRSLEDAIGSAYRRALHHGSSSEQPVMQQ